MMYALSPSTVGLVDSFARSLAQAGSLPRTEMQTLSKVLKEAASPQERSEKEAPGLMTVSATAKALSLHPKTVQRMLAAGELAGTYLRPGSKKTLRVKRSSIEALMERSAR